VEDSFKLLEERVGKVAARLRELRAENEALRREAQATGAREHKAEQAVRAAEAKAGKAEQERKAAAERANEAERQLRAAAERGGAEARTAAGADAEHEAQVLRHEREELRRRMVKLLEVLERLD
jgi:chromosome segregation ATPase